MQSGFNNGGGGGGGLPDFYTGGLRSSIVGGNTMNNHHPSQTQYHRSQLPGLFVDPTTSQIGRQTQQQQSPHLLHSTHNNNNNPASLIGKRTLAEFQFHQQQSPYQQNLTNQQNLYLRSLKPRTTANFQHSSPISPIDFSSATSYTTGSENSSNSSTSTLLSQRSGLPLLQQLRPQPIISSSPYIINNNNTVQQQLQSQAVHTDNNNHHQRVLISTIDSEKKKTMSQQVSVKKMIDHTLQELEKQLLDDNDEDEETGGGGGDAISVITNTNSEWSETIQNLMGPNNNNNPATQKPVSPSPTSSSSSSSSVASPATLNCSKQSLMEAAAAISEGKTEAAAEILTRLTQVTSPRPNSEQRLLEFMAAALKSRVNPVDNPPPVKELYSPEHSGSTQILYKLSPCFGLGFMAANLAILEATLEEQSTTNQVHVIDFDIGQGGQYTHLLHALSTRQSSNGNKSSSTVKITTVPDNNGGGEERLRAVRQNLIQVAEPLGVGLEFNVVSQKLSELSRESLGVEPEEPIAVNFAFKLYSMPDESVSTDNPRDELLRRVKSLAPRVVTLVEQELNTNTAPFMTRVNESCAYYGALLESIENSSVAKDSPDRVKAEEALSRKLANSVACEGRDRVERCEVFGKWRARMGMAGFVLRPMGQNVTELLKNRLSSDNNNNRVHPGFTVKEENGGISFGWISRTLTVASAWR